jgi:hypothetical protein
MLKNCNRARRQDRNLHATGNVATFAVFAFPLLPRAARGSTILLLDGIVDLAAKDLDPWGGCDAKPHRPAVDLSNHNLRAFAQHDAFALAARDH